MSEGEAMSPDPAMGAGRDGGQLVAASRGDLVVAVGGVPAERHPVAVYLARLSARSRRTMLGALNTVAALLTAGQADAWRLQWAALGYPHTTAVRTALVEVRGLAPATANLHLAALRGVLKEAVSVRRGR